MKYTYKGGGVLPGVPARDLTEEDVKALDPDVRKLLEEHMKRPDDVRVYDGKKSGGE
jgi:hypothetical protein